MKKREKAIKKWVEALRSGEYEQGTKYLNKNNKFCCLGVACEIFKDELGLEVSLSSSTNSIISYDNGISLAPERLSQFLGICEFGRVKNSEGKLVTSLVHLNDELKTFKEIADIIENDFTLKGN